MRIHIIACRVLSRELNILAGNSPHIVDITWLPQGLHDIPGALREMVQNTLDRLHDDVESGMLKHRPDAICLGYGLCSNGVVGLRSRDIPLIVPRTDDCIALFLGSQQRYLELFAVHNGTYWLNNGWIETCYGDAAYRKAKEEERRAYYTEKFDEDSADFLMEEEAAWKKNYRCCAFIRSGLHCDPAHAEIAKEMADEAGWRYEELDGDERMLRLMTGGEWNEQEFLICPPFHRIEAAYDGNKICALPLE